jgi:hypothetical protein
MALKRKRSGVGLDMRTFRGKEGRYLVPQKGMVLFFIRVFPRDC